MEKFALKTARDIIMGMALGCNFYIWRNLVSSFELKISMTEYLKMNSRSKEQLQYEGGCTTMSDTVQ